MLSLILDLAVKDGRLVRNVATGVNLPRVGKPEHRYLTHEQVEDLAHECGNPSDPSKHAAYDTRTNQTYLLVVLFLSYTGVRFGEMAALRVNRVDLDRCRADIVASVTPVQGQGLVWGTPKNHQRREVPIPPFLTAELRPYLADKALDDLVFPGIRRGLPCASAPSEPPSTRPPERSASPDCTPTSSGTPQRAWPSPPEPTSRSSNRCSATPQRR